MTSSPNQIKTPVIETEIETERPPLPADPAPHAAPPAPLNETSGAAVSSRKPDAGHTGQTRFTHATLGHLGTLCWRLALGLYFVLALLILTLRYAVLPHIEDYRGDIERALSSSLHLPVAIARIDAHWQGLLPYLSLHGLQVHDREGRAALGFDNIEAELSWTSLLYFEPRFYRLEIIAPSLDIRRDRTGRFFVAGLPLDTESSTDTAFSDWLLAQRRIVIRDARITWHDEQRGAPPLELQHLHFLLQNNGRRHRFGLTAEPPRALAARLDVRGDFKGDDLSRLAEWSGQAYADLDYADLAVWRQWLDYPIELPQGSGALRLWLGVARGQPTEITADIALHHVQMRLGKGLPLLDLPALTGRLSATHTAQGYRLNAQRLALQTQDGIDFAPTDFHFEWNESADRRTANGMFNANQLDFDALARLASHLPFDAATRKQLVDYAPRGHLLDLKTHWKGPLNAQGELHPAEYGIAARFQGLGVNAQGALPGFSGLSGSVTGDEQGGVFHLDSPQATLALPTVFAEPRIELGTFKAQARWKAQQETIDVRLEQASFENQDAAGMARGRYVYHLSDHGEASTPGEIDLDARLTRGHGGAVWRYIPLAVGQGVRDWLKTAIIGGSSHDTTLRLKGDLRQFPFDDGSGIFSVKGRFQDATLRYADSWPAIEHINGALEFTGNRMLIQADSGTLYGVRLSQVEATIHDLRPEVTPLHIHGKASGPTTDFLRFIEASPVGTSIDHFTAEMSAQGQGTLELKLMLPLPHLDKSVIEGSYQFAGNRLKVDADLPPLGDVQGRLRFTGDALQADRVRATLLGMPMTLDLKTQAGALAVNAEGQLAIDDLRQQMPHPILNQLSGSARWRGTVLARKKTAEVTLESSLVGIRSTLPEPFNKNPNEVLALHFERKSLPSATATPSTSSTSSTPPTAAPTRDQIDFSLGALAAARLIRRMDAQSGTALAERGALAIGEPLVMPEKGGLLAVNLKKINVDLWRSLLARPAGEPGAENHASALPLPLNVVTLKTQELEAFGHQLRELDARASLSREGAWHASLKSRDVTGELFWKGQGSGRLGARLKQLIIHQATPHVGDTPTPPPPPNTSTTTTRPEDLPGLDIEVDQFTVRDKALGKLKLTADNHAGRWEARLDIDNEDGNLSGSGRWQPRATQADTQLKFLLTAKSIEKLLSRLGYADAVKRGKATLEGQVSWNGAPFAIDYPSLGGQFRVDAENGQFNKLEPGVGRLLGVLSLQSLPRRITLDFRDVFSQGFAFDSINGNLSMNKGVIETRDLQISGPAAKVLMSGSASVPQETQNLKVRVQPAIGESLAVGAMIAHPAAGALAWLAQKVLRDPLDQAFAYDYSVTGSWADPKVEKLSAPAPQPASPVEKKN
ncbi:MAG: TIGR02099 family protein [Sterolibacterium sp.]|nr:TIGR02099 family protein [Sterolibacterium sp.]